MNDVEREAEGDQVISAKSGFLTDPSAEAQRRGAGHGHQENDPSDRHALANGRIDSGCLVGAAHTSISSCQAATKVLTTHDLADRLPARLTNSHSANRGSGD